MERSNFLPTLGDHAIGAESFSQSGKRRVTFTFTCDSAVSRPAVFALLCTFAILLQRSTVHSPVEGATTKNAQRGRFSHNFQGVDNQIFCPHFSVSFFQSQSPCLCELHHFPFTLLDLILPLLGTLVVRRQENRISSHFL